MKKLLVCVLVVMFACVATTALAKGPVMADSFHEMFTKGKAGGWLGYKYWTQDSDQLQDSATHIFGAKLQFDSAVLNGVSFRGSFYTSQDFGINDEDDSDKHYGLLAKTDGGEFDEYSTLGEYYIQGKFGDTSLRLGGIELKTMQFNFWPARLIPKSYEAFDITNTSIKGLRLYAGYAWRMRDTNTDEWKDVSQEFRGVTEDEGVYWVEGDYKGIKGLRIWMAYHQWPDVLRSLAFHGQYNGKINDDMSWFVYGLYNPMESVGDDLAYGSDYDTEQIGARLGLNFYSANVTAYWGQMGDYNLGTPRGGIKVIQMQQEGLDRADESAMGISFDYNFQNPTLKGLKFHAWFTAFDGDTAEDWDELDLELRYRPKKGFFKTSDFRLRWCTVDGDNNNSTADRDDFRFGYTYRF
jgi:hypothetical protein